VSGDLRHARWSLEGSGDEDWQVFPLAAPDFTMSIDHEFTVESEQLARRVVAALNYARGLTIAQIQAATPPPLTPSGDDQSEDETYPCSCHCMCCTPVRGEDERCPMCAEACGPEPDPDSAYAPEEPSKASLDLLEALKASSAGGLPAKGEASHG
jgi:hypothetical protein